MACHPRAWQKRGFLDFQAVGTGGRFLSAPWTPTPVHPLWDVYGMARTVMWTRSTYWWWQPVVPGLAGYPELPTEVALNKQIFPGTASCPGVTVAVMTKIVIWDPGKGWKNSTSHSSNYHNCPYVHQHRFFFLIICAILWSPAVLLLHFLPCIWLLEACVHVSVWGRKEVASQHFFLPKICFPLVTLLSHLYSSSPP